MDYDSIKFVHIGCVAISYALFFVRGVGMLRESAWLQRRGVKIVPHVVDTLLLASAIALAIMSRQYPLTDGWLTAKVVGLLIYIGLGMVAARAWPRGSPRRSCSSISSRWRSRAGRCHGRHRGGHAAGQQVIDSCNSGSDALYPSHKRCSSRIRCRARLF
jgi:uncharacterized membrane protein SirB2